MNYQDTITYLYNRLPVYQQVGGIAYKEGLDNSLALDLYFNHPHLKYKTIHVAGTNGKGSTSHLLAATLQQAGYKVGLYTSPHLLDFRERIRINGTMISEQYVINFVANHKANYEPIQPSFFELTMMMAFCYFADKEVDIAIIEVGLGGRLDSTNIITPIASVITNISLDHTQFLGNSLVQIAREKAGIIKTNVPAIIGEAEADIRSVFEQQAQLVNAPITFAQDKQIIQSAGRDKDGSWLFQTATYPNLKGQLSGLAQLKNAATVLSVIEVLQKQGITVSLNSVYEAFAHVVELTGLQGRWQLIQGTNPRIICDTGHNTGGIKYVVEQLNTEQYDTLRMVIGMVNDKDVNEVLKLLPKHAIYYFTRAAIQRALDQDRLTELANAIGLDGNTYNSIDQAIQAALDDANTKDLVFIGGSNFVVAEALTYFESLAKRN